MSSHRPFAASAAHRWLNCTASHALEAQAPRGRASKYAAEGTAAHEVAAALLSKTPLINADPELIKGVSPYVDFVNEAMESGGQNLRVEYSADVIPGVLGGTTDAVFQRRDTLHVCDLKYGRGVVVEAENNEQLMIYALACLPAYPTAKQICLNIIQPRAAGDTVKQWRIPLATLEAFQGRVFETVRRIQSGQTAFAMGEHCRFCAIMTNCPMQLDLIEEGKLRNSDHVLANLKQIRAICDAVEKSAFERLASGESIPGWKLVQKTARSKWAPDAFDKLHGTPGMLRTELVGITEARKLLGPELVDALIVRESSGYTIAPESDKRPAAMVAPGELDDLTGE